MKKILIVIMSLFLVMMTVLCLCYPKQELSQSERRKLNQFPELTWDTVVSGKFMEEFEEYAADQFPFRETWRTLKANIVLNVFGQSDNNKLYVENGHAVKIEYPLNEDSVLRAVNIFQRIQENQLKNKNCNLYYSVIPDKNYFLGEDYLQMDYEKMFSILQNNLVGMTYIDITEVLEIDDYYVTDTHWRQECIVDAADKILSQMGYERTQEYCLKKVETPFYGVYYGQSALSLKPDELCYLTNEILEACIVYDFENDRETTIYNMEKVDGQDPYEMFLSGSISLLEIQNPNAVNERELVIFRDSFGSALAPLLVEGYSKITLADIRYLSSGLLENYIDFQDADVLFIYSTSVLNHSETLK